MKRFALALLPAFLIPACLQRFDPPTPTPTLADIKNATYAGVLPHPVTLRNGADPQVVLLDGLVTFGNLDRRAGEEAAVLLSEAGKEGGERIYVAVLGVREGTTANLGTALIGTRTKVRDLFIEDGAVVIDVIEADTDEPSCCPTRLARKKFELQSGRLQEVASQVTGSLSIATAGKQVWTLISMDGQPIPSGCSAPTVQFTGIRLASFGGCNTYMGTVEERKPGQIKVSPLAGSRAMCSPQAMNLDQEFLTRLEKVDRYTFLGGRLALSGEARGAPFLMLFERPPGTPSTGG